MSNNESVSAKDIQHVKVCGGKGLYCAHPRQGGLWNFGNGELLLIHCHAHWPYADEPPRHGFGPVGYKSRCVWLAQRSTDGGRTWPEENNVVVWDETLPVDQRRKLVYPDDTSRQQIDMTSPDSVVCFPRTWLGDVKGPDGKVVGPGEADATAPGGSAPIAIAIRSADRGRTWEQTPTVIERPARGPHFCIAEPSVVTMDDGSMLIPVAYLNDGVLAAYGSDDDGLTWQFLSEIARPTTPTGGIVYPGLLRLPDGTIQCYLMEMLTRTYSICLCESADCYNWTQPRTILRWGSSPWRERMTQAAKTKPLTFPTRILYRSPWPLLLADGRILVVFARRKFPYGMGGIISSDEGKTWSDEFIIRDDASGADIGYPVVTQLDDGRIFTAYYYMADDGQAYGGGRFIAASTFSV